MNNMRDLINIIENEDRANIARIAKYITSVKSRKRYDGQIEIIHINKKLNNTFFTIYDIPINIVEIEIGYRHSSDTNDKSLDVYFKFPLSDQLKTDIKDRSQNTADLFSILVYVIPQFGLQKLMDLVDNANIGFSKSALSGLRRFELNAFDDPDEPRPPKYGYIVLETRGNTQIGEEIMRTVRYKKSLDELS